MKHKEITEKNISGSFEVHKFPGNGLQDVIYQLHLAFKFHAAGLSFSREIEQPIYYKDIVLILKMID